MPPAGHAVSMRRIEHGMKLQPRKDRRNATHINIEHGMKLQTQSHQHVHWQHTCGSKRGGPCFLRYISLLVCGFAVHLETQLWILLPLSLGSGMAACLRPNSLLCLPFRAMDLGGLGLYYCNNWVLCLAGLVAGGGQQVSGMRAAS